MTTIDWYINAMRYELEKLQDLGDFKGNIEFKLNWIGGSVASMNLNRCKCVTKPKN